MRILAICSALPLIGAIVGCTSTGKNAKEESAISYDYVAGRTGEDQVIVKDENASIHSDRDAVNEYTTTVNVINADRQRVESDLAGLALCRKANAEAKGVFVKEGPLTVPCMKKVVQDREKSGEDLIQVDGKLVLRKKDDFKARLEEATACLREANAVRDKAREDYMLEGCDKRPASAD